MPCSINFPMTLQNEILSIDTSDFLKEMTIIKTFNLVIITEFANSVDPDVATLSGSTAVVL